MTIQLDSAAALETSVCDSELPALTQVLHVINGEHYSGAERVQDLLAMRLSEYGFAPAFACLKPDRFPQLRTAVETPLFEVPMRHRFDFRPARQLARIVREHEFALLHAHTPRSLLVARIVSKMTGVPLVYHVHSPAARDSNRRLSNWFNSWLERRCVADVQRLVTVSESLAEDLRAKGISNDRITVVPNGVPVAEPVSRTVPDASWTLGTVALFRPRKGTEMLLDALKILLSEGRSVNLRAVGPFETEQYAQQLRQQVKDLRLGDHVEWTGFSSDVAREFSRMDLFVLPSIYGEGMPMVVLEAMSAGVPVVATRVEGVPEAVRDGIDGLLAEPSDPESLAECIRKVMDGRESWLEMRENALARQRHRFSDRSMASGVARVYRDLIGVTSCE